MGYLKAIVEDLRCVHVGRVSVLQFVSPVLLDIEALSFRRLPSTFGGTALLGNGIDAEVLRRAGIEEADIFIAMTQGDNRNVMAAQMARHVFNVPRVICRIYDPLRQELYATLGLETFSPTTIFAQMVREKIES